MFGSSERDSPRERGFEFDIAVAAAAVVVAVVGIVAAAVAAAVRWSTRLRTRLLLFDRRRCRRLAALQRAPLASRRHCRVSLGLEVPAER